MKGFFVIIFLFLFSNISFAQVINIDLKAVDSLKTTNSENLLFDVNGAVCSMVIFSTTLEGLKFYSNLGVEKVLKTEDGYRIWIPCQATVLKFFIPGFQLFEYDIPHSDFKYSTYIISLSIDKNEKIVIKDTLKPVLSIVTYPEGAKVFINGEYFGKSPVSVKNPVFSMFEYTVKKKGYGWYSSKDSVGAGTKNISIELVDLFRSKRIFLILDFKNDFGYDYSIDSYSLPGIFLGVFGKTGMYGSINTRSVADEVSSQPLFNEFHLYNKCQKTSLVAGITQQFGKSSFIYGGAGFYKRSYQRDYSTLSSKSTSILLNAGLVFRLGWSTLFQIDYSNNLGNFYSMVGIGFGFNLPTKPVNNIAKRY